MIDYRDLKYGDLPKVTWDELNTLLICSERYACGRATYIVGDIVEIISDFYDGGWLFDNTIQVMIKDIESCIAAGRAGMECDVKAWNGLLELLKGNAMEL